LCRDEMKKRKRHQVYFLDDLKFDDDSVDTMAHMKDQTASTPEELYHQQDISKLLKRALMIIPEEQRVVVIMKQYQGLKFIEIADILKEPVNTIKSRCYYGLSALKKVLEESQLSKEVLLHEM
jgi:RNA polymerase sigma-70 factor (ECF subfamily)